MYRTPTKRDGSAVPVATALPERRRRERIDPVTCEPAYTPEEVEFMLAMDRYKRDNRRPFPTWREVLEVLQSLGWRKAAARRPLPGYEAEHAAADGCAGR